jgi:hypothetical protein
MINILPTNETNTEQSTCICNPSVEFVNGTMIITHNSYDKRELIEELLK